MILIYLYFDIFNENLNFSLKKSCIDLWRKAVKIEENIPLRHTKHFMYYKAYEKNIRRLGWGVRTIHHRGGRSLPYSSPINLSWKNPSERKSDWKGKVVTKLYLSSLSVHLTSLQTMQNKLEKLLIFSNINVVFFST